MRRFLGIFPPKSDFQSMFPRLRVEAGVGHSFQRLVKRK